MAGLVPGTRLGGLLVQLGDLVLNAVDANGVYWYCASLDGWAAPDVRTTVTARESDHGSYMSRVYLAERVVTLAGTVWAPSAPALDTAIEQLTAAAGLGDTTLMVVDSIPRQVTARCSGQLLATRSTDVVATYSVQMTAPDPRRYATVETSATLRLPQSSGGLTWPVTWPVEFDAQTIAGDTAVVNAGTLDSRPQITIAGPVSQPSVVITGPDGTVTSLLYGGDIAAGDTLTLDCDAHTAVYNGTASRRALVSGTWPVLWPGQSTVSFRAGAYSADAVLTISFRSAWR